MRLIVTGETQPDSVEVSGGQKSPVIEVNAGAVFAVNGQTGNVTLRGLTGWVNAADAPYNAASDGIGDPTSAIQAAIDACSPGGRVYLPAGDYATTATLDLKNGVSLVSDHASLMTGPGMTGNESPCRIKPAAGFTGTSVIQIIGDNDGTHPSLSGEQRLTNILIDGANLTGSVDGLYARGNVQNVVLDNVTIKNMPNNGIVTAPRSSDGQYPYSWRMRNVIVDTCHANGYLLTLMTDLTAVDCQAIGCWATGWALTNMPNSQLIGCRAEWCGNSGFHLTGSWGTGTGSGGMQLTGCSTDRNGFHGVLVDATGNTPMTITGLMTRRDGRNGGTGGGGYAGIAVISATVPVTIDGIQCYPGIDDNGSGTTSPQYGARFSGASAVTLDNAYLHANTAGLSDDGTNTLISYGSTIITTAGATTSTTRTVRAPLLDWINVKQKGAKGDGTTDDTAAIQACIDAAAAAGGGTVYLPYGTYRISNSLTLKSKVTLRGTHSTAWVNRFPTSLCAIKPTSGFAGECAISMLGADITGSSGNEGNCRILDIELDGSALAAGSVSGIHAQGEVLDVILTRVMIKQFTHNGIHTNVGTGTKAPHDWYLDTVVTYQNASYGFSMSMTDGYFRNCIATTNGGDGWLLGPFGSLTFDCCQALWNTQHGLNIAGGTQVGNVALVGFLTDRNGHDGIHLGTSSGSGSPPIVITSASLNRDGRNSGSGGSAYAGLRIDGCANPVIVNGITVNTGVDDDGSGTNSPQYGISLTGTNAYVQLNNGYAHGNTAGINDDGTSTVVRRFNVDEATGSRTSPTFAYNNGVAISGLGLALPSAATAPATPSTGAIIYGGTSRAVLKNASGLNGTIPISGAGKTSTTTVSNTTTETVLHTFTIAGSDASAGSVYAIKATGTMDWTTGSPTLTLRVRLGGVTGAVIATCVLTCTSSASTAAPAWAVEGDAVCITTGSSGTWRGTIKAVGQIVSGGFTAAANPATAGAPSAAVTQSTTSTNDLVITAQWSAAATANTVRCDTGYGQRIR
ncbi:glycosyl hydrolase family 28-related protein [Streptomyces sp. NPDC006476]|uniref:glycosyl hydrolase family 28-related protein n=1 Tax=Streptomyces sp. NPDC006476 TaxID=3157175 RepID=UPI0033AFDB1D